MPQNAHCTARGVVAADGVQELLLHRRRQVRRERCRSRDAPLIRSTAPCASAAEPPNFANEVGEQVGQPGRDDRREHGEAECSAEVLHRLRDGADLAVARADRRG